MKMISQQKSTDTPRPSSRPDRTGLRRRRTSIIAVLVLLVSFGAVLGTDIFRSLSADIRIYNNVVKNLLSEYVDDIDSRSLINSSIEGMLKNLDPYTVFLRADDQTGIGMLTRGTYGGVGIRLGMRDKVLTVIAPMEGTPAHRAGVRPGDHIIRIDGIDIREYTTDKAARLIRGKPGTKVTLTFVRPGEDEPLPIDLIREEIKINDLPYYGLENGVGYINLTRFSKDTAEQLKAALEDLAEQGLEGLILDLRGNPGGLLRDAVDIVDAFVDPGLRIVETRGRTKKSRRTYDSEEVPVLAADIPLVILVNAGSASASEIVAGAIQDLDRGVIMGSETFGKGLVQSIFPLGKNTSLKITTAKYYIPSGRLIQREDYLDNNVFTDGLDKHDSLFVTGHGRIVKGGGGITPDVEMEAQPLTPLYRTLQAGGHFFDFATSRQNNYDLTLPIQITDPMLADFRHYIYAKDISPKFPGERNLGEFQESLAKMETFPGEVDLSQLVSYYERRRATAFDDELDAVRRGLTLEFSSITGGVAARIRAALVVDPIYRRATEMLSDPAAYAALLAPPEERADLGSQR